LNAIIGLKLQVTDRLEFPSLYDWCFQMRWLFSGVSEDPEDETVMEKHGTKILDSGVKCWTHAIWTEGQDAQLDAANWTIQIAKP
jgi:hypothetical protein